MDTACIIIVVVVIIIIIIIIIKLPLLFKLSEIMYLWYLFCSLYLLFS